jgi:acyl-coenzyme A synthetase/AMP-(fatty) acid ligase
MVDLFYPLVRGATVFLSPLIPLPPLLVGLIERERITHLAAVGSTLALVAETTDGFRGRDITSLRRLMTGAEVLDPAAVQRWLAAAPELTVVNGYGPTEATCLVVAQPISEREPGRTEPYPIGLPLDGVTVRFLRDDGAVDADGPGELLVAGEQVMLGYLDRPHEQQRAYLRVGSVAFYRTGDRGHRGADGTLFYHGRGDDEVKVRGYRVNLLEVRHALESHDAVGRAFVAVSTDRRGRHILACAVASPGTPRSEVPSGAPLPALDVERTRSLRAHLTQRLPGYMVPADYRLLPEIPMLSSGKPDTAGIRLRLIAAAEERG